MYHKRSRGAALQELNFGFGKTSRIRYTIGHGSHSSIYIRPAAPPCKDGIFIFICIDDKETQRLQKHGVYTLVKGDFIGSENFAKCNDGKLL